MIIMTTSKMNEIKKTNNKKTAIVAASAAVTGIGLGVGGTFLAKKLIGKRRKAQPQPQPEQDTAPQPQPQENSGNDGDNN